MATASKSWPLDYDDWPANQSNAARDRDDAAMSAAQISKLARRELERVASGEATRDELLYVLASIDGKAGDILRLLERNGAPTRPYPDALR